ncbi:hypothetical protein MAR_021165 [Mya arenaria]|uniref:Uncharacterized protein n=1 Tax=Mya arenaria TaxID=6604 RepID=A0ABY7EA55_MYAAR|nr:hypothetical protein MAR_021165 [Mya arenaria]
MADMGPNVVEKDTDKTERSSAHSTESSKKGKAPAKKNRDEGQTKKSTPVLENMQTKLSASEDKMLLALNSIQSTMKQHSEVLNSFAKQLDVIENYDDEYEQEDYDYEAAETEVSQEPKRRAEEEPSDPNNNRFKDMAKRIEEERYSELVKDKNNARPANCEGLTVVRMNQLIWDAVSPAARTADKKLQNIESLIVKGATLLTKVVDTMAKLKNSASDSDLGSLIENCNDALALLGHANKQVNLTRKDFLRPELKQEYSHLCSQSRPFTKFLFGDDISKSAKEIKDCSKISYKMFQNRVFRGPIRRGYKFDPLEEGIIDKEIEKLLEMDVISNVEPKQGQILSPIFLKEKSNEEYRLVINLKKKDVLWLLLICAMPISQSNLLKSNKNISASFGKETSINIYMYAKWGFIDDSILMGDAIDECSKNVDATVSLMSNVGFIINHEKSMFNPCKKIPYLGNIIDSEKMIVTLPADRQKKITDACYNLSCKIWASIRKVAQVIGMLVASFSAVDVGKMHYRHLEKSKTEALKKHKCNYDAIMENFRHRGFSEETTNILMQSWRPGTKKQYNTHIKRWFQYCSEMETSPFLPTLETVVEFLTSQYSKGLGYESLNTARGALLALGLQFDGFRNTFPVLVCSDTMVILESFFMSYVKPHATVTRDTISRWIKTVMYRAGINVKDFGSHSVRSAVTSKASSSAVPIADILAKVGWSRESTFRKFYDKPVLNKSDKFQEGILRSLKSQRSALAVFLSNIYFARSDGFGEARFSYNVEPLWQINEYNNQYND